LTSRSLTGPPPDVASLGVCATVGCALAPRAARSQAALTLQYSLGACVVVGPHTPIFNWTTGRLDRWHLLCERHRLVVVFPCDWWEREAGVRGKGSGKDGGRGKGHGRD
jgi:hypothetical protein